MDGRGRRTDALGGRTPLNIWGECADDGLTVAVVSTKPATNRIEIESHHDEGASIANIRVSSSRGSNEDLITPSIRRVGNRGVHRNKKAYNNKLRRTKRR